MQQDIQAKDLIEGDLEEVLRNVLTESDQEFFCNLSPNGVAKTQYAIASSGHWFDQLKIAELMIDERRTVLIDAVVQIRKQHREDKLTRLKIRGISNSLQSNPESTESVWRLEQENELGNLVDQLESAEWHKKKLGAMIRDSLAEMRTAITEKEKLTNFYKEELRSSFEDCQSQHGAEALLAKLTHTATIAMGECSGIPGELMRVMLQTPDHLRDLVLESATVEFSGLCQHFHKYFPKELEKGS